MRTLLLFCLAFSLEGQIVQPGAGGGGSNSTLTLPSSLGTCTNLSGSFTCTYATGQTPNLMLGTDASGNVGPQSITPAHLPSAVFPSGVLAGSKTLATLDQIPAPAAQTGYQPNQVLSGCGVDYLTGLTYQIGACTFTINGATYSTAAVQKTLATADATNPRIDAIGIGLDASGVPNVFVTTGTPATNPVAPVVDSATSIGIANPPIAAAATVPTNTAKTTLFDIGTEWTLTPTTHLALSTTNPYSETHDIEATAAVLGNNFTLVKPASGTEDLSTRNNLVFYIRSKAAWPTGNTGSTAARTLTIFWRNGTTQIGSQVVLRDGQFGFSSSNTTTYQLISIPVSLFATSTNLVTTLVMQVTGNTGTSSIGFYVDSISLQGGTIVQTLPTTVMNFRGTYSSATAYNPNDLVVSSGGISYVAIAANTNQAVTSTTYWKPLSTTGASLTAGNTFTTGTQVIQTGTPTNVGLRVKGTNQAGTSPAYVQGANCGGGSCGSVMGSNVTAGNTLVATYVEYNSTNTPSISDTRNSTWTLVSSNTSGADSIWVWVASNITAGADTVTITDSTGYGAGAVGEYSNVLVTSPLDAQATLYNSLSGSPISSASITTGTGNDLVLAIYGTTTGSGFTASATGYTVRQNGQQPTTVGIWLADAVQASTGTYSASWTNTSTGRSLTAMVALKPTGTVLQSGNLQEWTSSAGTILSAINSSGQFTGTSLGNTLTIASGTAALGTSAIASGACATVVTATATGVVSTDVLKVSFNGDPTGVTGYAPGTSGTLTIIPYPTANAANFKVCNNTASSITPGAITLNWQVQR